MSRRLIMAGQIRRPARCALVVSPEILAAVGYPDLAAAHDAAACARLWSADRRRRADRAALDRPPAAGTGGSGVRTLPAKRAVQELAVLHDWRCTVCGLYWDNGHRRCPSCN